MPTKKKRRRRRRLRPQFIAFCAVMLLILAGIVFLATRCVSGILKKRAAEKAETVVEETQPEEETPSSKQPNVVIPVNYVAAEGDIHTGDVILVNNDTPYTFPAGVEMEAVWQYTGNDYMVRDYSVSLQKQAAEAFDKMLEDFAAETGIKDVLVTSAYRSYEEQEDVFNSSASKNGMEHTQRYVAQPGYSEHHTGLAVDFSIYNVSKGYSYDFDGKGDYKWIVDHCAEYGIIQRYPPDKEAITGIAEEGWHFRYVGGPHAMYMAKKNQCLEEYINRVRNHPVDEPIEFDKYKIYFCPEGELYVPMKGNYTVSGNNVDGFIVVVG